MFRADVQDLDSTGILLEHYPSSGWIDPRLEQVMQYWDNTGTLLEYYRMDSHLFGTYIAVMGKYWDFTLVVQDGITPCLEQMIQYWDNTGILLEYYRMD